MDSLLSSWKSIPHIHQSAFITSTQLPINHPNQIHHHVETTCGSHASPSKSPIFIDLAHFPPSIPHLLFFMGNQPTYHSIPIYNLYSTTHQSPKSDSPSWRNDMWKAWVTRTFGWIAPKVTKFSPTSPWKMDTLNALFLTFYYIIEHHSTTSFKWTIHHPERTSFWKWQSWTHDMIFTQMSDCVEK